MLSIEFQFIYRHYRRFIVLMSFNTRVKRRDDNLFSVGQSLYRYEILKCFKRRSEVFHKYDQVCQYSIFFVIHKFDDILIILSLQRFQINYVNTGDPIISKIEIQKRLRIYKQLGRTL